MPRLPSVDLVDAQFVFVQNRSAATTIERAVKPSRAIVLIHGFHLRPLRSADVGKAFLHSWQRAGSNMVTALAAHGDVYAFAYSQNVAVDEIVAVPALAEGIGSLRQAGYEQIVLVGHSAGGLIARQFVEDHPDAGVTRVVQICTPNRGAALAKLDPAVPKSQRVFLQSLTKEARGQQLAVRAQRAIPAGLEFACVVGCGGGFGDGLVSTASQWPADLQQQGVPVQRLLTTHFTVVRAPGDVRRLVEIIVAPQPRTYVAGH